MHSPTRRFVIGVDGGTESIRSGIFDARDGSPVAFASCPYETKFPRPGWAEQDPASWWKSMGTAIQDSLKKAGIQPDEIAAIGVDTTCCTVVVLDEVGDPLRPALLWMDMRSGEDGQTNKVAACTGDEALLVNGGGCSPVSAEWMIPKALWIKENEPELFHAATTICEYQDYINFKLTGRRCVSINNISVRWNYSTERGWPVSLLEKLGLSDLKEKWPSDIVGLGEIVGGLTKEAAACLGLNEGTAVAQGGADAFIGMVGLGCIEPGQLALLTGSSHLHLGVTDKVFNGPGVWGVYKDALLPGVHVVEGGQTSTGSAVAWLRRLISGDSPGTDSDHLIPYKKLNEEALAVPLGSDNLLCLDHFQGNRTPHTDPLSRGAIVGLTLAHSRGHVFRAVVEGICFGTEAIMSKLKENGYKPDSVTIAGGASNSDFWLQTHADVANLPMILTKCSEACSLGSAVLAAVAAGIYPTVAAACKAMVHVSKTILPNEERHQQYIPYCQRYNKLYPLLKELRPTPTHSGDAAPTKSSSSGSGIIVNPSILAADFSCLGSQIAECEAGGAQWLHVDICDGAFAPGALTMGPPVVKAFRKNTKLFLDCHLAVNNPIQYLDYLQEAGADQVTFHIESMATHEEALALCHAIQAKGMKVGIAVKPGTDITNEESIPNPAPIFASGLVHAVDLLLVNPGFGGQKPQLNVLSKAQFLRDHYPDIPYVMADGGIGLETAKSALDAGVNVLIAGSAIFCAPNGKNVTQATRELVQLAQQWPNKGNK